LNKTLITGVAAGVFKEGLGLITALLNRTKAPVACVAPGVLEVRAGDSTGVSDHVIIASPISSQEKWWTPGIIQAPSRGELA
jgi:hypothetical protein